jgi:hypothetical protein
VLIGGEILGNEYRGMDSLIARKPHLADEPFVLGTSSLEMRHMRLRSKVKYRPALESMESRELLSAIGHVEQDRRLRLFSQVAQGYEYYLGMVNKPTTPIYPLSVTNRSNLAISVTSSVTYNNNQVRPVSNIPNGTVIPAGGRFVVFADSNNASFNYTFTSVANGNVNGAGTLFTSDGVTTSTGGGFIYPANPGWAVDFQPTQSAPYQVVTVIQNRVPTLVLEPVTSSLLGGHRPRPRHPAPPPRFHPHPRPHPGPRF